MFEVFIYAYIVTKRWKILKLNDFQLLFYYKTSIENIFDCSYNMIVPNSWPLDMPCFRTKVAGRQRHFQVIQEQVLERVTWVVPK